MSQARQRVLIFEGQNSNASAVAEALRSLYDVEVVSSMDEALSSLRTDDYHAVFADVGDFLPLERGLVGEKSSLVLNTIGEGVCIVDADGLMTWANKRMRSFNAATTEHVKRVCRQAMMIFNTQTGGGTAASQPRSKKFTFQELESYFEVICSPVVNDDGKSEQVVAVVWDATSGKRLQAKIDAIDSSGRELARIDNDAVAKLRPAERLKLLQDKIIRYSKDLMHFDHFAIRLLDKRSNKLEVVIAEGLPDEALEIDLYAQPEGNGISGYVGATGRSYICHDVEKDPRYVLGLHHSKSSLTVPLNLFGEVVGVYNVESERVGAFTEDDRQFAEIFGRYVALALNILDLLVVERYNTSTHIAAGVVQEMTGPLNDIVTEAQTLMEEYIGDDAMRQRLHRITEHVGQVRRAIDDVKAGTNRVIGGDSVKDSRDDPVCRGKRVLIADDEPNIRKVVSNVMRKYGMEVTAAKDGYEACSLLEQKPVAFDLVVSDIKMPYRNGYEIYAAAQRAREGLPVLLMTGFGYDPHHSIVRASQDGLSGVLFKPFKVEQFMDEVRSALAPSPAAESDSASKSELKSESKSDAGGGPGTEPQRSPAETD